MNARSTKSGYDSLTGLPRRDRFEAECTIAVKQSVAQGRPLAVVLIDIDLTRQANQRIGEPAMDTVIRSLAEQLKAVAASDGTLYRFGGDAFLMMLSGCDKENAFLRIEIARKQFHENGAGASGKPKAGEMAFSFSAGVAAMPDDGSSQTDVVRKCHDALYRAKTSGRNRVCLAREEKMVTKTVHYTQGQLDGLSRLAIREGLNEATLLREAIDDLLRKYNR